MSENKEININDIDNNIQKIYCLKKTIDSQCAILDIQIQELQNERNVIAEPYQSEIEYLENNVISEVVSMGKSYKGPLGAVNYRKGYDRRSWDNDKLEGYGKDHPEILDFKKVTPVSPNASIKLNK